MKLLAAFYIISIVYMLFLQKSLLAQSSPQSRAPADYSLFTGPTTLPTITNVSKSNAVQLQVGNPPAPAPTSPTLIEGPICSAPPTSSSSPQASVRPSTGDKPEAPPPPSELQQAISDQFGINISGFGNEQLQWTWEKLWEVSNTKFIELARGTNVTVGSGSQTGCKNINLPPIGAKDGFTIVLFHEIGHIIRNCSSQAASNYQKHLDALFNEGSVSNYARELCTYGNGAKSDWVHESEDFAEMITYYLHPGVSQQTVRCAGTGPNPYSDGEKNLHFEVAKSILGDF